MRTVFATVFVFHLTLLVFALSLSYSAESQIPHSAIVVTVSPAALLPDTKSDPAAIQALTGVITASGGMNAWRQTRSSRIRLSITPKSGGQAHDVLMMDDWSSGATVYRRGAVGSKNPPHEHSAGAPFRAAQNGQGRDIPEFDQARVLAGTLPAAAAEIILRNHSYVAVVANGRRCTSGLVCVDVYRQVAPNTPFLREEEWVISQSTGLPTAIDLSLPNLMGTRPLFQEFRFAQMATVGHLQIPSVVEMQHPSGAILVRSIVSFIPNAPYDHASFDKELSK
jgi:hypothetical protein